MLADGSLTLDAFDQQVAGVAQEFVALRQSLTTPPADPEPIPESALDPAMAERVAWLRKQYADGMLTRAEALETEGVVGTWIVPRDEPAAEPDVAADSTDSTGDPKLDAKIATLRAQYAAGELDLEGAIAATRELAAEIAPDTTAEEPAPAPALTSFLISVRTFAEAVRIVVDAFLEGRPHANRT
jgi:hypothetical protein